MYGFEKVWRPFGSFCTFMSLILILKNYRLFDIILEEIKDKNSKILQILHNCHRWRSGYSGISERIKDKNSKILRNCHRWRSGLSEIFEESKIRIRRYCVTATGEEVVTVEFLEEIKDKNSKILRNCHSWRSG